MPLSPRTADLDRLNALTKYPSIPTYHVMGGRGGLTEETVPRPAGDAPVLLTEKVDGTNARVCLFPDGSYLVGSRGEWLTARGDLVANPALGIVAAVREAAERLADAGAGTGAGDDGVVTFYGEVFGGKVTGASKQYTGDGAVGFRLFDVARVPDAAERLARPADELSAWREGGGPTFLDETALQDAAARHDLPLTARVGVADALPPAVADAAALLEARLPKTLAILDDGAGGRPEGLVARTADRSWIAKLRFDDYRRTLKRRG